MQLTPNFALEEFACHDGTPVPAPFLANVQLLAFNLQVLRDFLKQPVHVLSGYRTPSWNAKVGGVKGSQHVLAKAGDLHVDGMTPSALHAVIEHLIDTKQMRQGGLGLYPGFVHYDVRGTKARWNG